jgi:hypothetical protein
LAQVLLDLVETHTGKVGQPESAEEVIRFLDVQEDSSSLEELPGYDPQEERNTTEMLHQAKIQSFAELSTRQAGVLVDWLRAAKEWPDLSWYRAEVESALSYWSKRASP